MEELHQDPARRPRVLPAPHRQHAGLEDPPLTRKLFAEKVMPHLRDLWPEWKDDDRWWIHPLEDRLRPESASRAREVGMSGP